MQLTVTAQSLSAKHRADHSRLFRHAVWLAVLIALTAVGAWRTGITPTQGPFLVSQEQTFHPFHHRVATSDRRDP